MKKNGRSSFRPTRRYKYTKTNHSFSYNKPRAKGNVAHLHEKYTKLAKEASSIGDRIQAEYYHQFADHYSRIMVENGIKSIDNENISEDSNRKNLEASTMNNQEISQSSTENNQEISQSSTENNQEISKSSTENNQEISQSSTEPNIKFSEKKDMEDEINENDNSIETVSFISKPASKTEKLKK